VVVGHELRTGDILAAADESAPLLEVEIEAIPAMALEAAAFASAGAAASFGHAVGNRHWDLATQDRRTLLHPAAPKDRTIDTLAPHLPDTEIEWETVPPDLFDRDDVGHAHAAHGEHG
jgi:urease accessory protein